jgi:hypothetical protein
MAQGYSFDLVEANKRASAKNIGVALGRVCIKARIPVTEVASFFGVSRMTIYNWFKGDRVPRVRLTPEIDKYILNVKKKLS